MIVLKTKDTTVCTGLLLHEGQPACFTDSTKIDTSGWVGNVDPKTRRGGSQSVKTNVFAQAEETYYVNPLVAKANAMKCINIVLFRVLTAIKAAEWEDFTGPRNCRRGSWSVYKLVYRGQRFPEINKLSYLWLCKQTRIPLCVQNSCFMEHRQPVLRIPPTLTQVWG